jgi:hypothetical protein
MFARTCGKIIAVMALTRSEHAPDALDSKNGIRGFNAAERKRWSDKSVFVHNKKHYQ